MKDNNSTGLEYDLYPGIYANTFSEVGTYGRYLLLT